LSTLAAMSTSTSAMFVTLIYVIKTGSRLGWTGSNLLYDGAEMSRIKSIYDVFVKLLWELICDTQYMTLSKIITYVFL
jgi:hypothetical protein